MMSMDDESRLSSLSCSRSPSPVRSFGSTQSPVSSVSSTEPCVTYRSKTTRDLFNIPHVDSFSTASSLPTLSSTSIKKRFNRHSRSLHDSKRTRNEVSTNDVYSPHARSPHARSPHSRSGRLDFTRGNSNKLAYTIITLVTCLFASLSFCILHMLNKMTQDIANLHPQVAPTDLMVPGAYGRLNDRSLRLAQVVRISSPAVGESNKKQETQENSSSETVKQPNLLGKEEGTFGQPPMPQLNEQVDSSVATKQDILKALVFESEEVITQKGHNTHEFFEDIEKNMTQDAAYKKEEEEVENKTGLTDFREEVGKVKSVISAAAEVFSNENEDIINDAAQFNSQHKSTSSKDHDNSIDENHDEIAQETNEREQKRNRKNPSAKSDNALELDFDAWNTGATESKDDTKNKPLTPQEEEDSQAEKPKKIKKKHKEDGYKEIPTINVGGQSKLLSTISWRDLELQTISSHAPSCNVQLDPSDISFTLVTQVSEDRLWMLTQHCARWPGPISAALFTNMTNDEAQLKLNEETEKYGGCSPNQVLLQTLPKRNFEAGEYPVNTLRNLAMKGVATSHIFYADIDFWESRNLYKELQSDFIRKEMANDHKLAIVVPAFQMTRQCEEVRDCREENMIKMPATKTELIKLVKRTEASAFDPTNKGGHGSTSYSDWVQTGGGDLWEIPCIKSNRYEPYLAVRLCQDLPPYQEVFTGYGKNKMTQIMQMRRSGYVFSQIGGEFVVHYPHLQSKARKVWAKGNKQHTQLLEEGKTIDWAKYKRGRVDKIFVEFRKWMNKKVKDKARLGMCVDAQNDDEKLWV